MTAIATLQKGVNQEATPDWSRIRADFPILNQTINGHPLIYFDNAATSQKPRAVIDALRDYYERDNSNVHRGIHELSNRATGAFESAREKVARFLNARESAEVIFTRGTTESLNLVAQAWARPRLKPGDRILLTEMEHHSNLVPWQMVAAQTGAELRFVPVLDDGGLLDLDRLDHYLDGTVKLFAFTHISNMLGTVNPAREMCARAREHGVVTVVDAAQSAGHVTVDLQQLGCDFLAFSGHKVCGPTGIGVLVGRRELLESMEPYQGGGEMISTVEYERSTWNQPPHKFEAGTPDIAGAIGLGVALDYLETVGRDRIFAHDQALAEAMAAGLTDAVPGIRLFGPQPGRAVPSETGRAVPSETGRAVPSETGRAGLVSFDIPGLHSHDLVTMADRRGAALRGGHHCTMPLHRKLGVNASARASFYFYNTAEEVERAVEVIADLHRKFCG